MTRALSFDFMIVALNQVAVADIKRARALKSESSSNFWMFHDTKFGSNGITRLGWLFPLLT
jgi:hypothetical protein